MACRSKLWLASSLVFVSALSVVTGSRATPGITFVNLGSSQSLYYDIGRALCSVVDLTREEHGIRCSVQATPGSIYNLAHLVPWDLDFALVQSDAHYVAYQGEGNWQGRPFTRLRSVMSLYPEVLTLMAPAALGMRSVDDLKGQRVNIGPPGSGTRATWDNLQSELKWSEKASVYGLTNDVPTFGARATLVTTAEMPESVVYALTKALLEELDVLRAAHPALAFLEPARMATDALTAPSHPGAERAFREHGVLPERDQGAR